MSYQDILLNMLLAAVGLKVYRFKGVSPEKDWLANLAALFMLDYLLKGVFHG